MTRSMEERVPVRGLMDPLRRVAGSWQEWWRGWWPFPGAATGASRSTMGPRLAAGALLLDVASADGALSPEELRYIERVLCREYGLGAVEAGRLLRSSDSARRRRADPRHFTNEILEGLSHRQRELLAGILRGLAYADGAPSPEQEYAVRKIASLLRVEAERV